MRDLIPIIFGMLMLLFGVVALANWAESISCREKWADSTFKSDYGFFKGCVIQLEDGTWIPSDNYREIP